MNQASFDDPKVNIVRLVKLVNFVRSGWRIKELWGTRANSTDLSAESEAVLDA
jgi:hypothetical protein